MNLQTIADVQDAFNDRLMKAKALVDILSNCRVDQLQADSISSIANMLSEAIEALGTTFNNLASTIEGDTGSPQG
ncbi:MAG: hypothetical protein ABSF43_17135 [Rectinemataceae bacterium]|jgi:hypothetical protein